MYEILDELHRSAEKIFCKNGFYNSEGGSGGGSIRIGSSFEIYEKFVSFFELKVDANYLLTHKYSEPKDFIIDMGDVEEYIEEVKHIFENPPEDIIYNTTSEDIESIKDRIPKKFKEDIEECENFTETPIPITMHSKRGQDGNVYVVNKNNDSLYSLLRRIAVPSMSYQYIYKLRKNQKIVYYLVLSTNEERSLEKFYFDSKEAHLELCSDPEDLKINPSVNKQLWASLFAGQNVILTGVPGTGKTHLATYAADRAMGKDGYVLTTATSDWTTFDTIGGLIPKDDGELVFREGKFLQAIKENKWLIIDEINRADIDKAFGQLFTVLSGQDVELPYYTKDTNQKSIPIKIRSCDDYDSYYDKGTATYFIGKDWRIIATMNSYDKNALFDLSYAFMRRFMIIEIGVPDNLADFIRKLESKDGEALYDKFSKDVTDKLVSLYGINKKDSSAEPKDRIKRQLGPAIFLDILKYLYSRMELEEAYLEEGEKYEYDNDIFSQALIAYVIPQFEGLGTSQRKLVKSFIENDVFGTEDSSSVINKLEEMQSLF